MAAWESTRARSGLTRVNRSHVASAGIENAAAELGPVDKFDSASIREDGILRDGDGGVYWLMATFLPGFRQFRYPAKLFTFTAIGVRRACRRSAGTAVLRTCGGNRRVDRILLGITACTLLGVCWPRQRPARSSGQLTELDVRPARCHRRVPGDRPMPGARRSRHWRWDAVDLHHSNSSRSSRPL